MSKFSLIFFCLLFFIFPSIKSDDTSDPTELTTLVSNVKDLFTCFKENSPDDESEIESLQADLANFSSDLETKLKAFFAKKYQIAFKCLSDTEIPLFPDGSKLIDFDEIFSSKVDWVKMFFCVLNLVQENGTDAFENLVKNIREENLFEAVKEVVKLLDENQSDIKECVGRPIV